MTAERRADIAFAIAIATGLLFVALLGPLDRRLEMAHTNDFSGFWAVGRAVDLGVDPYDPTQWSRVADAVGWPAPSGDTSVPNYMPWTALFLAAVALMPIDVAAWVWMALGVAFATLGLRGLLREYLPGRPLEHAAFGAALFLGQPTYHALVLGQWSPFLLGCVAVVVLSLRRSRPLRAAVASLAFLLKPQLFVFAAAGIAVGALRSPVFRRAALFALVLGAAAVAIGSLVFPDWLAPWLAEVPGARTARSAVLPSVGNELAGTPGRYAAYVVIAIGALAALRARPASDASLAGWLSLSIAGAVYAWSYDQVLLLAPLVIAAGVLARSGDTIAARGVAIGSALTFIVVSPILYFFGVSRHDETFSVVVPVAVFIAIVVLLARVPDQATTRRSRSSAESVARRRPSAIDP